MNVKRLLATLFAILLTVIISVSLISCDGNEPQNAETPTAAPTGQPTEQPSENVEHTHEFGDWIVQKAATCTEYGSTYQECECGFKQYLSLLPTGHVAVDDLAIAPTCTQSGKTAGSHCGACGYVITTQTTVDALGHTYGEGVVQTTATCTQDGVMKYTCTVSGCGYVSTEGYSLSTLSAGEIHDGALSYVGEILIYDKYGEEYALGTGFVITADGQIVTNYHVIEGAYSAIITIGDTDYEIESILAFDKTIDLVILQIDATDLPTATLCTETMSVGSPVYAIGSSQGMTNTFSQGIVTYWNRDVDGVIHVQHDASLASGNSGGPLINAYGEVIGVNTWTLEDSQNLNFAVSVSELENLTYIDATPLDEFANEYYTPFDALYAWIEYNCTTDEEAYFCYDEIYDDGSWYSLGYDFDDEVLYIDILWEFEDGYTLYACIEFGDDPSEYIYCVEYADSDYTNYNYIDGYINAASFSSNTALTYDYTEGNIDPDNDLLAAYQEYLSDMLAWLEITLEENEVGVTLEEVGFTAFNQSAGEGDGNSDGNEDNSGNNTSLDILYTWVENNQTSSDDGYICYDEYYDDGSWYSLGYDTEYGVMYVDVLWEFEDGYALYSCIEFDESSSDLLYYCQYADSEYTTYNYIEGYINAPSYTSDTALTYDYTEGDIAVDDAIMEAYQVCVADLVAWFDSMLAENSIGVTVGDVGFVAFVE